MSAKPHLLIAHYSLLVFLCLFAVYMIGYSGVLRSGDAESMLAVTESLVKRGAVDTPQMWWSIPVGTGRLGPDGRFYSKYGLGLSLLAAPLYWLALVVPRLGLVQTVLLLNPLLTALTAAVVCLYVSELGYRPAVAVTVALAFGLGTAAFVYAKYLFSEPLSALALLAGVWWLLRYRREGRVAWAVGAGLALGLALATRLGNAPAVAVLAVYGFASVPGSGGKVRSGPRSGSGVAPDGTPLCCVPCYERPPAPARWRRRWRGLLAFGTALGAWLALVGLYNFVRFGNPWQAGYPAGESFSTPLAVGLWGLLFSPERGLFLYTPLAVVSVLAWPAFFRRHRAEALAGGAVAGALLLTYAAWWNWAGGMGYGPRFLVPALPFLAVMLAPAVEWAGKRPPAAVGLGLVALLSLAVQVVGVGVNFRLYDARLVHPAAPTTAPAVLRRWPILGHLSLFQPENLDVAWVRATGSGVAVDPWPPLLAAGLAVLAGAGLVYLGRCSRPVRSRRPDRSVGRRTFVALLAAGLVSVAGLSGVSLARYYDDPRFGAGDAYTVAMGADYHALLAHLREAARPDDVVLLANRSQARFFQNYNKARPAWYALARPLNGELTAGTLALLDELGRRPGRVWLVEDSQPAAGRPRPVERWLAEHAYHVADATFSDTARLCLFATGAPGGAQPGHPLALGLGPDVALRGFDLGGGPFRTDDVLLLSLVWQATASPAEDYTVFVQVLDEGGQLRAQVDRYPVGGFRPTSSWAAGETVRDNYGLRLDVPPGRYRLIAGMYRLATMERLPVLSQGVAVGDHVLLDEIDVVDGNG